jgi:hypothetical protein
LDFVSVTLHAILNALLSYWQRQEIETWKGGSKMKAQVIALPNLILLAMRLPLF